MDERRTAETVATQGDSPAAPRGPVLRGTPVAPGLALGRLVRVAEDPFDVGPRRVPLDRVEHELNRFHRALGAAQGELAELRGRLEGRVPEAHVRILDTHVAYLRDSVFISDVENQILNEQMSLEAAIGKVVADFDRIFKLVESEALRERAVDLRDVGIRVLRCLEREGLARPEDSDARRGCILVARELSIVDLIGADGEGVLGIVAQEGGPASHAALLARSMGVPTLVGVEGLLNAAREGDFAILDASEGLLRVRPEERVLLQYRELGSERGARAVAEPAADSEAQGPTRTADGVAVEVDAGCGNLPQVERAVASGVSEVGLYRTELQYLLDARAPSFESLLAHYDAVLELAAGRPVTFRLLAVDSALELDFLHAGREPNPALGSAGIRALLANEDVLRRQLRALLVARPAAPRRVALPFVSDPREFARVAELAAEERHAAQQQGLATLERLPLAAILETPVSALQADTWARLAEHLLLNLDGLAQYLLAVDRENRPLAGSFDPLHPVVLRVVGEVVAAAERAGCSLAVFGSLGSRPAALPILIGLGVRRLIVAPDELREVTESIRALELPDAQRAAREAGEPRP